MEGGEKGGKKKISENKSQNSLPYFFLVVPRGGCNVYAGRAV